MSGATRRLQFDVSIIVPAYNASDFIQPCVDSVLTQRGVDLSTLELVVFDDSSTDDTCAKVSDIMQRMPAALGRFELCRGKGGPTGCGSARNRAIEQSSAPVLIFLDADDVMATDRVQRTLVALRSTEVYQSSEGDSYSTTRGIGAIGGNFTRIPTGSTPRYEAYHKRLAGNTSEPHGLFVCSFRDAPLAMPTLACLRRVWEDVGKFAEGLGLAEDLIFQYGAMEKEWTLVKLGGDPLVHYRFHPRMTSLLLSRRHMLDIRVAAFEKLVLGKLGWTSFSIWGAGRDGKEMFQRLSEDGKRRVLHWGEINPRKIGLSLYGKKVVHFSQLEPPIAACVALDRTDGEFEASLAAKNLRPGLDYVYLT
jgi:glycosyltransferase involved in cell wall biosynthesis